MKARVVGRTRWDTYSEYFEELLKELFARAIKLQVMMQDLEASNSGIVLGFLENS